MYKTIIKTETIKKSKCLNCRKEFYTAKNEEKRNRRFCSRKCCNTGIYNPFYNKKHTTEAKCRIGDASIRIHTGRKRPVRTKQHIENLRMSVIRNGSLRGPRNPAYKGIIDAVYDRNFTNNLKEHMHLQNMWRCQICGNKSECIHHIDYNKKNSEEDNLISLCWKCHSKTNFNREKWIMFFKEHYSRHFLTINNKVDNIREMSYINI